MEGDMRSAVPSTTPANPLQKWDTHIKGIGSLGKKVFLAMVQNSFRISHTRCVTSF